MTKCPKCAYQRKDSDYVPDWQCPSCGIAYEKFFATSSKDNGGIRKRYDASKSRSKRFSEPKNSTRFRNIRIGLLLLILLVVALDSWSTKSRIHSWDASLQVVIYPIKGDNQQITADIISKLDASYFTAIDKFMQSQAKLYGLSIIDPINVVLGPEVQSMPPLQPVDGNFAQIAYWSLKLRYWAYQQTKNNFEDDVRIFLIFHDPEIKSRLAHSTGLEKGMISVAHVFASKRMKGQNNIVIAHELLHTLGATDKYQANSGQPIYPMGYAEPDRLPLHPQTKGEIMAGRIPISETESEMPDNLKEVVMNIDTVVEIGWVGK